MAPHPPLVRGVAGHGPATWQPLTSASVHIIANRLASTAIGSLMHTCLLVQRLFELVDWGRDAQTGLKHGLLSLQAHIARPADEVGQVPAGLDVAT